MQFWTLAELWRRGHGLILAVVCSLCFLSFSIACLTDLNHPPGVRNIRLATIGFILVIGGIEYLWTWRGIALFTLLWPFQLLAKFLLVRDVSVLFSAIPDLFDWPIASVLTVAIVCRQLITIPPDPLRINDARLGLMLRFLPSLLYAFATLTVLSVLAAYPRLQNAPPEWNVHPPDFRRILFIYNPLSIMRLFWVGIPIVVNSLFLIALLRSILFERRQPDAMQLPLLTFLAGMGISSCIVISQISGRWHWEFDNGPPAGPFSNRNTLAPMLVLAAAATLSCKLFLKFRLLKYILPFVAMIFSLLTIATGSRNGVFLIAALPWACLWIDASMRRVLIILFLAAVGTSLLFWIPLPQSETVRVESLSRTIDAVTHMRAGNWDLATSYRNQLWIVAGRMALKCPLLGCGPGTYYIHASQVPETRIDLVYGVSGILAHSTPVNLIGENGIPAALLWMLIWIAIPATMIMQSRVFLPATFGLFLLGLSNVFDTLWYVNGGMTIAAFWMSLALYEHQNTNSSGT